MYACASAVKATIKTVSFQLNGTDGLRSLSILNVKDKSYKDKGRMPLWGVEDSGKTVDQITPVWGLISPTYENYPNISTVRQPSLYIPGYAGGPSGISGLGPYSMYQNLPASDFFRYAMSSVFGTSTLGFTVPAVEGSSRPFTEYSGYSSVALFQRWQNLSKTTTGAATIVNLIWTDMAAPAVVGTKGVLGHGNAGLPNETVTMTVSKTVRKIKYHYLFAIPAIILAVVLVVITLLALLSSITRRSTLQTMRERLNQSSVGRLYTWSHWPVESPLTIPSKEWSQNLGTRGIDINASNAALIASVTQPVAVIDNVTGVSSVSSLDSVNQMVEVETDQIQDEQVDIQTDQTQDEQVEIQTVQTQDEQVEIQTVQTLDERVETSSLNH